MAPSHASHEEGSGSVLAFVLCMAIILACGGVALLWAGALTHTRTQNAADMAAYAGASTGSCTPARTIAQRSGMEVLSCRVSDGEAAVELQATLAWARFRASAQALTLSTAATTSATPPSVNPRGFAPESRAPPIPRAS